MEIKFNGISLADENAQNKYIIEFVEQILPAVEKSERVSLRALAGKGARNIIKSKFKKKENE